MDFCDKRKLTIKQGFVGKQRYAVKGLLRQ